MEASQYDYHTHIYAYPEQYDYDHGLPPVSEYDLDAVCEHSVPWNHDYHNGVFHHHYLAPRDYVHYGIPFPDMASPR